MIANLLIGFREGLEAALIVSILAAYLVKTNRRTDIGKVWIGTSSAVALAVLLGLALSLLVDSTPAGTNEFIAGLTSLIACIFVTWMVFWMARQSREFSADLKRKLDTKNNSAFAVAAIAFLAVIREGLETSVFLWSTSRAAGSDTYPLLGAAIGLALAAALGYLMYRGSVRLNLTKFFKLSGAFLIVIAAGILSYGIAEFQEIGLIKFLNQQAFDISHLVAEGSTLDTILRGTISFSATPSVLMVIAWVSFVAITATAYFKKPSTR